MIILYPIQKHIKKPIDNFSQIKPQWYRNHSSQPASHAVSNLLLNHRQLLNIPAIISQLSKQDGDDREVWRPVTRLILE